MTDTPEQQERWKDGGIDCFDGREWDRCIEDENGDLIAQIPTGCFVLEDAKANERCKAIADLIASAPDLARELAALRAERDQMRAELEWIDRTLRSHPGPNGSTHFDCWVPGIRVSIVAAARRALTPEREEGKP